MSPRSQHPRTPSSPTRSRSGRYNPHSGGTTLLEPEEQDRDQLVLGQLDSGHCGTKTARSQKPKASAPRRSKPKSQPLSTAKSSPIRRHEGKTRSKPPLRRKSNSNDLKATIAPLLVTVGVALLIPAIWSTLLLLGIDVPGAERKDARPMAAIMLLSWPIAICLIAAAVAFFIQVVRQKQRLAKKN